MLHLASSLCTRSVDSCCAHAKPAPGECECGPGWTWEPRPFVPILTRVRQGKRCDVEQQRCLTGCPFVSDGINDRLAYFLRGGGGGFRSRDRPTLALQSPPSYSFFRFPHQESSRNSKTSSFRTQRLWPASLICAIASKLLPDPSPCQASTTIKQVSAVWAQGRAGASSEGGGSCGLCQSR